MVGQSVNKESGGEEREVTNGRVFCFFVAWSLFDNMSSI